MCGYVRTQMKILAKNVRVKLYNHACVCSCVGPIVDVKEQSDLFYRERYMANILASGYKDVFLPSVYDALLLTRPTCDFRDGRLITSSNFTQYLIELAFNDSYLFAMMHLIPADYYTCRLYRNIRLFVQIHS